MLVSRCAKSLIHKHVKAAVKTNFKRRLRPGFKPLIRQKLFKCQNHGSNRWNKLHDVIVEDQKEREFVYRHIHTYFQNTKNSLPEKFISIKRETDRNFH